MREDYLAEALDTCLQVYNHQTGRRLNLVFFREAALHCARLSRVLAMPRGHSVLISTAKSIGRTTLVKLASFIAHCKVNVLTNKLISCPLVTYCLWKAIFIGSFLTVCAFVVCVLACVYLSFTFHHLTPHWQQYLFCFLD